LRARFVLALTIATLVVLPSSAAAYWNRGYDPDDRKAVGFDPDVQTTTRRVFAKADGKRYLVVEFTAYEKLGLYWSVRVRLDARGDSTVDHDMVLYNLDQSGKGCRIHRLGSSTWVRGDFLQHGDMARCRVPAGTVRPTKRIRWKLISITGYEDGETEYAPNNRGWYV
jgi:hypothetical protein